MKTEKLFAVLVASAALQAMIVSGQDQLFNLTFSGSARPGTGNNHAVTKLTTQDLIEQCVGTGTTAKIRQTFALVYNATQDSIQVVNRADGSVVCDLFHFDGGTTTVRGNRLDRLTFLFEHDQTESSGSAVITEKSNGGKTAVRPHIAGKMQFTLPATATDISAATVTTTDVTNSDGSVTTGETAPVTGNFVEANALAGAATDQQVCRGSFTVGRAFVAGVPVTTSSKKKKNKNTNTSTETTSTETTTTDNTTTTTTTDNTNTGTTNTNQTSLITTNGTQISTNSLGTTNGLGGNNVSILTLFPGNLTTH